MHSISTTRTAIPLPTPQQLDSFPSRRAQAPNTTAALYPADGLAQSGAAFFGERLNALSDIQIEADRTYLVAELDAADKLAGLAFLCLEEGDVHRAQEFMQEATDIRKAVEPNLTPVQQRSLAKVMSLQADAFHKIQNAGGSIFGFVKKLQAKIELSQAAQESQKLRNSILAG